VLSQKESTPNAKKIEKPDHLLKGKQERCNGGIEFIGFLTRGQMARTFYLQKISMWYLFSQ
tara:strand:- start:138 stop:320 length:183 start_codon:yes stop_codon:yes gene_type:complete